MQLQFKCQPMLFKIKMYTFRKFNDISIFSNSSHHGQLKRTWTPDISLKGPCKMVLEGKNPLILFSLIAVILDEVTILIGWLYSMMFRISDVDSVRNLSLLMQKQEPPDFYIIYLIQPG